MATQREDLEWLRAELVAAMSFRFQVVKDVWAEPKEVGQLRQRTIKEVRLFELGPVVFPAYADTTVALRSLVSAVPGLTLSIDGQPAVTALPAEEATSEEPAPAVEARSSDEAGEAPDPAPSQSAPLTKAQREQIARRAQLARLRRKDV